MKKRVLHLLASNSYSGAENVVCTIIDNCCDKYDMYYCSLDGPIKGILEKKNIKFIPLKRLSVREIKKIIKDYKIDIIHAHDYKASFISVFLNKKIISHIHCDYNLLWCSFLVGSIYSIIQKRFDKIILISKEILDSASYSKRIVDKTVIINNVVDADVVREKSLEFKSPAYDLAFVGRLEDVKRPEIVIEITKRLKDKYPNIKTCIVGNGSLYDKCRELIKEYNLEKNIELLGFKSNPFPYVKNSKVMVVPSRYEGLGLVAIEAMILGTVVVNSGAGGLRSIFKDYPKYICNNVNEYVECIEKLFSGDKNTYRDDCIKMNKNFTNMKKYKNKLLEIYEEVLNDE